MLCVMSDGNASSQPGRWVLRASPGRYLVLSSLRKTVTSRPCKLKGANSRQGRGLYKNYEDIPYPVARVGIGAASQFSEGEVEGSGAAEIEPVPDDGGWRTREEDTGWTGTVVQRTEGLRYEKHSPLLESGSSPLSMPNGRGQLSALGGTILDAHRPGDKWSMDERVWSGCSVRQQDVEVRRNRTTRGAAGEEDAMPGKKGAKTRRRRGRRES